MKAALYEAFAGAIAIATVADPTPAPRGVVLRVAAAGLCRSDWHGWMGHDPDIVLPHVPGHEFAGVVEAVGSDVRRWRPGDRVTVPFVGGCGACVHCAAGDHQVCDHQFQPGFTAWGAFADFVAVDHADVNLVRLPDALDFVTAASLGCRFATAFRAVVDQGRLAGGQWLAVHGCGGVGLSAIMIGRALGARVLAVDIDSAKLAFAAELGADAQLDARDCASVPERIHELTGGGAHLSIDALGDPVTCSNSISSLRKRGRHVQVGLMLGEHRTPAIPMDLVIARELEILGSHGMQAHRYDELLAMIDAGRLAPQRLLGRRIGLDEVPLELPAMDRFAGVGVTVIDRCGGASGAGARGRAEPCR